MTAPLGSGARTGRLFLAARAALPVARAPQRSPTVARPVHAADPFAPSFDDPHAATTWRRLFGTGLHAHSGLFGAAGADLGTAAPDNDAPFVAALDDLRQLIAPASSVHDAGCGWGAQAMLLTRTHACRVTGVTASAVQHGYCASLGLDSRQGAVGALLPAAPVDCVLMLESLESVRDKLALLRALRQSATRLVIRIACQEGERGLAAPGAGHPVSSAALRALLGEAGWRIRHWQDRRAQALPSIALWNARLALLPHVVNPRLSQWRRFCGAVAQDAQRWAADHPLLDIVAE